MQAVEDPERWYRDHYALVWDTARRYGIPADAREDVVQETFLAACRRRPSAASTSMRSWLYGIARRVAANHRRTDFRRRRKQDRLALELELAARSGRIPEAAIAAATLDAFLAELKPADRELFVLSEIEGFTGPEIARALGCNLATTYSRIRSVRHRFTQECAEPAAAIEEHRSGRPRATAAGWAALMPQLQGSGAVATAATWFGPNLKALLVGMAAGGVIVTGAALVTDPPPGAPEPVAAATTTPSPGAAPIVPPLVRSEPQGAVRKPPAVAPEVRPRDLVRPEEPQPTPRSKAPPAAAAAPAIDLDTGALLREAKRALKRGDPKRALALAEQHGTNYPSSALADVRVVIRVKALCGLGRNAAAQALAGGYLATHPGSPMAKQLRRGCGEKKSPEGS